MGTLTGHRYSRVMELSPTQDKAMTRNVEDLDRFARELDWNLLRTFLIIVEEGSLTSAANRLLLKQPTISAALKRLEDTLDRRLLERGRGDFRLTDAGELLYRHCVDMYGEVCRLPILLREARETLSGHVKIMAASHVVCPIFDDVLREFHKTYPHVTFSIDVAASKDIRRRVMHCSISLGLCLAGPELEDVKQDLLLRQHFGLFCGPGHRLFGQKDLALADLRGEAMVSFIADHLGEGMSSIAELRQRARLAPSRTGTSTNLEELKRMIVAGLGIGPLPLHVAESDIASGRLWRLPPYDDPPIVDICLLTSRKAHLNRAEDFFIAALHDAMHETPLEQRLLHSFDSA